jgi:hypothetical protein
MTHRIQTRSGALYLIDDLERIWVRIRGAQSEALRTDTGVFTRCIIAEILVLYCPPLDPTSADQRVITSSLIESVEVLGSEIDPV